MKLLLGVILFQCCAVVLRYLSFFPMWKCFFVATNVVVKLENELPQGVGKERREKGGKEGRREGRREGRKEGCKSVMFDVKEWMRGLKYV